MKTFVIDQNSAHMRADKYVKKLLDQAPVNLIYKMFRKKDIKVNGKWIKEDYILQEGDTLSLFLYEDKFKAFSNAQDIYDLKRTFKILYEDEHILVVNKPAGLLVHEDQHESRDTLTNQVLAYLVETKAYAPSPENTFVPGPVHRLDRNTSGIVIFGKTLVALQTLNEMMKKRHCIDKTYLTICKGKVDQAMTLLGYACKDETQGKVVMVSKDHPGALTMHTLIEPVKFNDDFSLLKVKLVTGRTHQIRVHLASVHHEIIGDSKYGDFELNKSIRKEYHLQHQFLHAYQVVFVKPFGALSYLKGKKIEAPLPNHLKKIEERIFHL